MDLKQHERIFEPRAASLGRILSYMKERYKVRNGSTPSIDSECFLHPVSNFQKQLCAVCTQLHWNPSTSRWALRSHAALSNALSEAFKHHKSLRELQESAESCPLCAMIRDEVLQAYAWKEFRFEKFDILRIYFFRNRNLFPTNKIELSEKSLASPVILWTHKQDDFLIHDPSHIQIGTMELLEEAAASSEPMCGTFGDLRESRNTAVFKGF